MGQPFHELIGRLAARVGDGAHYAKTRALVEEIMADDQRRTTSHLLVAGLGIKG